MRTSRRNFLQLAAAAGAATVSEQRLQALSSLAAPPALLSEFGYRDVELAPCLQQTQFESTQAVLMGLNEDSLLKPFRLRAGMPAPGADLGGWYDEFAGYDYRIGVDHGFAPAASFGQWISALARGYAATGGEEKRAKVERLLEGYSKTIGPSFYQHFRFPAYTYDKIVQGLIDAHEFCAQAGCIRHSRSHYRCRASASAAECAGPRTQQMCSLPHDTLFPGDKSFCWDESYTLPESLFIAYRVERGKISRFGNPLLKDDTYFDPLSQGKNVLPGNACLQLCQRA